MGALLVDKKSLIPAVSTTTLTNETHAPATNGTNEKKEATALRIKIRLRQENILLVDEFDYDVNTSGVDGCDPISIACPIVNDLKLPAELGPTITSSIVDQMYGVEATESLDKVTSSTDIRKRPTSLLLDV